MTTTPDPHVEAPAPPRVSVYQDAGGVHIDAGFIGICCTVEEAEKVLEALLAWKESQLDPGWDDDPLED